METIGLSSEEKLVILLSRLTFSTDDVREVIELIQKPIESYTFLNYLTKNKVVGLAYANLKKLGVLQHVPLQINQLMKYYYIGNQTRNKLYQEELQKILLAFHAKKVPCFPLKGALLLSELYLESGTRSINDIDLLIQLKDSKEITDIMTSLGYLQGNYDYSTGQLQEHSREKNVSWKMNMNTLPTFVKLSDSKEVEFFMVDFSFSLNLDKHIEPVDEMIMQAQEGKLLAEHFLVHLCCHLYKEATGAIWIYTDCDMNTIKFCDVREYILIQMDTTTLIRAVEFANYFGLQHPLYFTFYYLQMLYNDGYEEALMNKLDIKESEFVHSPSSVHSTEHYRWKKSFWKRLFAFSNKEELGEKFKQNYKNFSEF
ncbi:nucleotidyltransferase family protein [Paenibacillus massiliensis]|uniref:nucleotidyltransferase family protein n=1 Tax=Paenibacillus massiliensis TaxID=225917 RepID=UPI00038038CA|nr:nucleotidyltransferase family protein [Paenibacillus massiliensis]